MAVSVTSDLAVISSCDTTASLGTFYRLGGSSVSNPAADADTFVEGAACIAHKCSTTVTPTEVGGHFNSTATVDLTNKHLFVWRLVITAANMVAKASGGVAVGLTNTSTTSTSAWSTTNMKKWYVDGSDTMPISQGWKCYVIDPASAGDATAGTLTLTTVKNVGLLAIQTSSVTSTLSNLFTDVIRMGTGLVATTTAGGDVLTLALIFATDTLNTNAWGIVTKYGDVYYGAAKITIGSTTQTNVCNFTDTKQVLVWRDMPVSATLYELLIKGASGFKTTVTLTGWVIKGQAATAKWAINCSDAFSDFKAYSCTFSNLRDAVLSAGSVLSATTIAVSGPVTANGAAITGTTFDATTSATAALLINSVAQAATVTSCIFTANSRAVKITAIGTYAFNGHMFSGNTYDIENSSAGLVTIQCTNGSNPSSVINTGGGTTVISTVKTLTLSGLKSGTEVRILAHGTMTELAGEESNTTGSFVYTFSYTAGTYVDLIVHHLDYQFIRIDNYLLSNGDVSLPIQQTGDRQYNNPV